MADEFAIRPQVAAMEDELLPPLQPLELSLSVLAFFPLHDIVGLVIDHNIFIFQWQAQGVCVDREQPVAVANIVHGQWMLHIPRAQGGFAPEQRHTLIALDMRCRDTKHDGAVEEGRVFEISQRLLGPAKQIVLQREVAPLVLEDVVLRIVDGVDARYATPLLPDAFSVIILDLIVIFQIRDGEMREHHAAGLHRPRAAVAGVHKQIVGTMMHLCIVVGHTEVHGLPERSPVFDLE